MWLTDLATVARSTGYPVVELSGWRTRGHGPMVDVRTVICHHTAGASTGNYPSLNVVKNGRPGLDGPLAQYGLGRDGTIYVIAAGLCWHAGVSRDPSYTNSHAIGIEAENTGTGQAWPAVQMDAYAALCRALCAHYRLPVSRVLGHKETCAPKGRKSDPSFDMDAFRARVEDDMPLTAAEKNEIADLTVSKLLRASLKNSHDGTIASLAAWVVYGNEKAGLARDNSAASVKAVDDLRAALNDTVAVAATNAVKAAIADGTLSINITVNGAPQ